MNDIDRSIIESMLNQDEKRKDIAYTLSRNESTISKEIYKRRVYQKATSFNNNHNFCKNKTKCDIKHLCGPCVKHDKCSQCEICNDNCPMFISDTCIRLIKYPFVCNGCQTKKNCRKSKYYYKSKSAQENYKTAVTDSKRLIRIDTEAFWIMNRVFTEGVLKGQSPYHIKKSNPELIPYSLSHLYWLNSHGKLATKNIDFARMVRRKVSKTASRGKGSTIKKEYRQTRTYHHYLEYVKTNSDLRTVQMDTVIGERTKGKVLLTLFFVQAQFLLIYIMPDKTAKSTVTIFDELEVLLGADLFSDIFQCLLTDNGAEFSDVLGIEHSKITGEKRTNLFFCDPSNSNQKSQIEKSHHFIREILPKSKNFDYLTQETVQIMTNNINSIKRKSLNGKTPFEMMEFLYTEDLITNLGLAPVPANDVTLKPRIVK